MGLTEYAAEGAEGPVSAEITGRPGGGEYEARINGAPRRIRVLRLDAGSAEFVMDGAYHHARYEGATTREMRLVVDGVPVTLGTHSHLDGIVYKNSGGGGAASAQTELRSQIPGKVVSVAVSEGAAVGRGDVVCTLESMKMQVAVKAHRDGTAGPVRVREGDTVAKGDVIAEIT